MHISTEYQNIIKILVLGQPAVGKSAFVHRFTKNIFSENHLATTGFDLKYRDLVIDDKIIRFQIWDTAGQERYQSVTKNLFLRVQGISLLFDITSTESFESLSHWLKIIRECNEKIPVIICGNKSDLESDREILTKNAEEFADQNNCLYHETSSKLNKNITETFLLLYNKIMENEDNKNDNEVTVSLNETAVSQRVIKGGCCKKNDI